MAVTGAKFEAYHSIREHSSWYVKKDKKLDNDTIIKVALTEYDVNLTKKDIEEMRKDYTRLVFFYKYLL